MLYKTKQRQRYLVKQPETFSSLDSKSFRAGLLCLLVLKYLKAILLPYSQMNKQPKTSTFFLIAITPCTAGSFITIDAPLKLANQYLPFLCSLFQEQLYHNLLSAQYFLTRLKLLLEKGFLTFFENIS